MRPSAKLNVLTLALVLGTASLGLAQDWDQPYDKAVGIIEMSLQQNAPPDAPAWTEAIGLLQQAVAIKPEPQTGRFGMLVARRKKYFPYFYLGVAALRSGRWDQSIENFKKSREFGAVLEDDKLGAELRQYESQLYFQIGADRLAQNDPAGALESFQKAVQLGGLSRELKAALDQQTAEAQQKIEAARRQFDTLVQRAQTDLGAGRFASALQAFNEAQRLDSGEYERRQLSADRTRAENGQVDQLMAEVRSIQAAGATREAYAKLRQALSISPDRPDVREVLREMVGGYQMLKEGGDTATQQKDWASAVGAYRQAILFFPRESSRDRLAPRLESAIRNLIRESVYALITGEAQTAAGSLEKALEGGVMDARVNAYLGVAYAKLAFLNPDADQFRELYAKAAEQFRRARQQDPALRLAPRIISPLILELFQEAGQ